MSMVSVRPTTAARTRLRPVGATPPTVTGGFWAERLRTNRERTIPHGFDLLRSTGTLDNLRVAAGAAGRYRALADSSGATFPFLDSDVYKWLEAVGWELGRPVPAGSGGSLDALAAAANEAIGVVAAAQRPDGYVNSYWQGPGREPHTDLAWGHEFYCVGHLVQAAVAWHRALGDDRLLTIATRAVDRIDREFGPGGRDGIDGHPGIEMALVELARTTGEQRYLRLAQRMIDLRGHGLIGGGRFGPSYWQDHSPVREAAEAAGHVVRQLYLDSGAVDVAVELGDEDLLAAVRRRWADLIRTRTYLTGGMGSRHKDEAFGDPFELPPDRAYTETCAAIAAVMLAWRLLLATGDVQYADAVERIVYNGVLPGLSLDGTGFFYTNPLQRRTHRAWEPAGDAGRRPWYPCACCPPNLMRTLSSWPQYLATADDDGVQLHQYATADVTAETGQGTVRLSVETDYPWDGAVAVRVQDAPEGPWTLSLRVPEWCGSASLRLDDEAPVPLPAGRHDCHRQWAPGDTVVLTLDLPVRVSEPHPRVDAVRGCAAVERGPLVYCLESVDLPDGTELEELRWDATRAPAELARADGDPVVRVAVPLAGDDVAGLTVAAVPYYAWANRGMGGMRVWIPR